VTISRKQLAPLAGILAVLAVGGCERERREPLSVVISVPPQDLAGVAKATILVDYSGSEARIVSDGGSPACAFILPGIDGDFVDDRKGTLTIHTQGRRALRGPADIVACQMEAAAETTAQDVRDRLTVRVAGAEDATGKAIDTATKPARSQASSPDRSERAIEAAQAEAAKTAAAISAAAPPLPAQGAPGSQPLTGAGNTARGAGSATGTGGSGAAGPAGTAGQKTAPRPPSPSGSAVPGAVANNHAPQADGGVTDNGPAPNNQDPDPGYDDSPSDDARVPAYTIEFQVAQSSVPRIGALQLEVTHLGSSGGFVGRGQDIDCVALVDGLVASNYLGERTAKIGIINLQGIPVPAPVMRCGFRTREPLSPASFMVQVVDASTPGGDNVDPPPNVGLVVSRR
jgi:hypothetical protein